MQRPPLRHPVITAVYALAFALAACGPSSVGTGDGESPDVSSVDAVHLDVPADTSGDAPRDAPSDVNRDQVDAGATDFDDGAPDGAGGNDVLDAPDVTNVVDVADAVDVLAVADVADDAADAADVSDAGGATDSGVDACVAAPESCNGLDDDCNGLTDDGLGTTNCGSGACATVIQNCVNGAPQTCPTDNGRTETCNNVDDNCNGQTDENLIQNCYTGAGGTVNVGACRVGVQTCTAGIFGACAGQVTPVTETCNGLDDDCNGLTDDGLGATTCGVGSCAMVIQNCINGMPQACPTDNGRTETCNNVDDNCNGQTDENLTQGCYTGPVGTLGVGRCRAGTQSCTSGVYGACVGQVTPVTETCNGFDDDCNGQTDENLGTIVCGSGSCAVTMARCVNGVPQTCPVGGNGTPEVCNNLDDNCDGQTDEGLTQACYSGPAGTLNVGRCRAGTQVCSGGVYLSCMGQVTPTAEQCNNFDDDCNGITDDLGSRPCGTGACATTIPFCIAGVPQNCPSNTGSPEACNGIDDNCNGQTDENLTQSCYSGPAGTLGVGICHAGTQTCSAGTYGTCTGQVTPAAAENCNNSLDDNCDGRVNEGCPPPSVTVTCPPPTTGTANTDILLTASATSTTGTITGYTWTVTSQPTGGGATFQPNASPAASGTFRGQVSGTYTLHVSAVDSTGAMGACDTTVTLRTWLLRVVLTWDGAGDLDLHMHNSNRSSWFSTDDVYYAMRTTMWDSPSTADDGVLDFDNTNANGPEQNHIDLPVVGETYTIGVHNYARGAGRIATVSVYCGPTGALARTLVSRGLSGTSSGNCTNNDFWKAGTVVFDSTGACTVAPIDTYQSSSTVCTGF